MGKLILRLVVGAFFMGHGLQKLRGWFGGPGIEGTTGMMGNLGMHPPRRQAYAASLTETVGGAAIVLGAATPAAAAALIATMLTAVRKVHWTNGPWNSNRGWEYNAVLAAAVAAVATDGPGPVSIDAAFGKSRWGIWAGLGAIAVGVGGSFAAIEYGRRSAPEATEADDDSVSE